MKKTLLALSVLVGCTTAEDARVGTRRLLSDLGIEAARITCVGTIGNPVGEDGICTVKTTSGDVLVIHCVDDFFQQGCTMVRPGAGQ